MGTTKTSTIARFLLNFFNNFQVSSKDITPKVLIVGEHPIKDRVKCMIRYSLFEDKVFYLSAKGIDEQCLSFGCFNKASVIFYLGEISNQNWMKADKKALFINQYLSNNNIQCPMYF
jgi:hypothetical protein